MDIRYDTRGKKFEKDTYCRIPKDREWKGGVLDV